MAGVTKQRQPPPGYPSGGETKVEQPPQRQPPPGYPSGGETEVEQDPLIDDISDKAQQNGGEDDGETDRGISVGFRISRPRPRLNQVHHVPSNRNHGQHGYIVHGQRRHPVHNAVDDYEGGYENQLPAYSNRPQQFYGQPPRRGNNYYPNDYRRY